MADYMQLDIVTPSRQVLSRQVTEVIAPGEMGEFGVLYGHTPFLTALKAGRILARAEGEDILVAIGGGFAEVAGNKIIVLAESAELAKEINLAEARAKVEELEQRFNAMSKDDPEYPKLYRELGVAKARLCVAQSCEIG
ncbi:MAG: ATP synthase epsilon chain [Deltaproteobacteria bacterium ADurb.Bin510]|nr:MAG: ATP synthase epsilon chain [Deltaproteobacteria bacterium ADurb.Bin510]